jgi:hypothetical protein
MLLIGYQNFSTPTTKEWDSQTSLKIIQEMQQFEKTDPGVPTELAVPQSGSDFESVRNNWAERQSKLLLNGYDKKFEDAVNDTLNSYIQKLTQREPADESPHNSETADKESTAAASGEKPAPKKPIALKFPRPNMIKYEVSSNSSFNVIADPGNTRVNYSQAYNDHTRIGIEHKTSSQQTQMFLNYDW